MAVCRFFGTDGFSAIGGKGGRRGGKSGRAKSEFSLRLEAGWLKLDPDTGTFQDKPEPGEGPLPGNIPRGRALVFSSN